jgi:hypothetical protein
MPAAWASGIGAAVGAVGGIVNGMNSNAQAAGQAANNNAPWQTAQPYIEQGYTDAQNGLNTALGMGTNATYTGERVAGLNPYQTAGADQAGNFAAGQGASTVGTLGTMGTNAMTQGANYGNNATNLMDMATNPQGAYGMGSQYANSSETQNMINAADLSASQNLNESTLPSLLSQGEGQGGNDNTRTGVAMGVATANAQQDMLANAANIQGQMFNEGSGQYNEGIQNGINANGQVGQSFNNGGTALMNGENAAGTNLGLAENAGGVFQNQQQNLDNAAQTQFTQEQQNPLQLTQMYQGIINGSYGGADPSGVGQSTVGDTIQGMSTGGMTGAGLYNTMYPSSTGSMGTNQYGFSTGMGSPDYGMSTGSSGGYNYTNPSYGAGLGY